MSKQSPATQTLTCTADPAQLYCALGLTQKPYTALLESADISTRASLTSLLVTESALHIECYGNWVLVEALTQLGARYCRLLEKQLSTYLAAAAAGQSGLPVTDLSKIDARLAAALEQLAKDSLRRALFVFPASTDMDERARLKAPNPVAVLRALQQNCGLPTSNQMPYLVGGFAYDFIDSFEALTPVPAGANDFPDYSFDFAQVMVKIDHEQAQAQIMGLEIPGEDNQTVIAQVEQLAQAITQLEAASAHDDSGADAPASADSNDPRRTLTAQATISDEQFTAQVAKLQTHIASGDIYQVVPSRGFTVACPDAFAAYRQLRIDNPSPYMFYLNGKNYTLFGASPESNLKYDAASRIVQLYPIAGTRQRGLRPDGTISHEQDIRAEFDLRTDSKELAEHIMLVDLARNDLARIAVPGTRAVADLLGVDRYSRVMHLVSRVVATLAPDLDALDAYRACMNMGTLTGAPKLSATNLLRGVEKRGRGCYGGAVGYLSADGSMDTCIVIRSAYVKDGQALVQAGAGVVRDSDPQAEADETWHKASAVIRAIAQSQNAEVEVAR